MHKLIPISVILLKCNLSALFQFSAIIRIKMQTTKNRLHLIIIIVLGNTFRYCTLIKQRRSVSSPHLLFFFLCILINYKQFFYCLYLVLFSYSFSFKTLISGLLYTILCFIYISNLQQNLQAIISVCLLHMQLHLQQIQKNKLAYQFV